MKDLFSFKVHIFWEGHKILWNLHLTFDYSTYSQKLSEDFAKFCGLLRIYELYYVGEKMFRKKFFQIPDDFWGHFRKKKFEEILECRRLLWIAPKVYVCALLINCICSHNMYNHVVICMYGFCQRDCSAVVIWQNFLMLAWPRFFGVRKRMI